MTRWLILTTFITFSLFATRTVRRLAHGGQQQSLNLEIVRALPVTYPADKEEQREIVTVLEAIDRKIDLHRRKRVGLDELFKALLRKLMTGEIKVGELEVQPTTEEVKS